MTRLFKPVERLLDALVDPALRERTAVLALVGYCAVWSLYGAIAKGSQDIHFDMGEMVVWSREAGIGTPKHPPLGAWLVRVWFSVFPLADWAYYLFAMVLTTFALWVTWHFGALPRRGKTRRRRYPAHVYSILQLPRPEIQRQHSADPALGARHVVVPALV